MDFTSNPRFLIDIYNKHHRRNSEHHWLKTVLSIEAVIQRAFPLDFSLDIKQHALYYCSLETL